MRDWVTEWLRERASIPEVDLVIEVPGRSVTDDFPAVCWLLNHRILPEVVHHRVHAERDEEIFSQQEQSGLIVTLTVE